MLLYLCDHGGFFLCEIEVAVREDLSGAFRHAGLCLPRIVFSVVLDAGAVPALSGKTAQYDHSRIGIGAGAGKKLGGERRLYRHAGNGTLIVLFVHIGAVEIAQRLVEGDGIVEHLKAIVEIVHIRYGHIAAAAASLDIIKTAFSKECNPAACF